MLTANLDRRNILNKMYTSNWLYQCLLWPLKLCSGWLKVTWMWFHHLSAVYVKASRELLETDVCSGPYWFFRLSREATWSDRISSYTLSHRTHAHTHSGQKVMTPVLGGLTVRREKEERGCCLKALGGLACGPSAELEQMWPVPHHQGLRSLMSAPNWTPWHLLTDGRNVIFPSYATAPRNNQCSLIEAGTSFFLLLQICYSADESFNHYFLCNKWTQRDIRLKVHWKKLIKTCLYVFWHLFNHNK